MMVRSLALCAVLALAAPLAIAQQDGGSERKLVLDNFDLSSRPAKPATSATTEKSAKADTPPPVENKASKATSHNSTSNTKGSRKKEKAAVLKSVTTAPKGEGYLPNESDTEAPPPPPKIYSELHTSINDDGRLMLTSDTIIVKSETRLVPTALGPSEST